MTDKDLTPRARATGAELGQLRELHVSAIVNLMGRGEWATNGHIPYADENKLSPHTVAEYAGEASRRLRAMEQLDAATLRGLLVARLERYEHMAAGESKSGKAVVCDECGNVMAVIQQDLRVAVAAVGTIAKIEGLEKTVQQQAGEQTAENLRWMLEQAHDEFQDQPEIYERLCARWARTHAAKSKALPLGLRVTVETTHGPSTK